MNSTDISQAVRSNGEALTAAAVTMGQHLLDTAIWDSDHSRCTWLGRRDIQDRQTAAYAERNAALSPELYSGTTGIALFLDALYRKTGRPDFGVAAYASWRRSLHFLKSNEFPASAISFYAGELGLLYVGYRLAESGAASHDGIAPDITWLCRKIEQGLATPHSLDVIGGNAGAIGPLLQLARRYTLPGLKDVALACADEIVKLAIWKDDLCVWEGHKIHGVEMDKPPLTGFSHGASGIALALLLAYEETKNDTYLRHARGAFAFEEQLFNPDEGNWIDTRYPHFKRDGKIHGTFRNAWCHGSPGIALAHLSAKHLDGDRVDFHEQRLTAAVRSTRKILQEKSGVPGQDTTLCHGIFGLTDILLSYALKEDPAMIPELQAQVLGIIAQYESPIALPSGLVCGGYSPSLLVGLSGIGLHLLRLTDPGTVPSVLLVSI